MTHSNKNKVERSTLFAKKQTESVRNRKWNMKKTNARYSLSTFLLSGIVPLFISSGAWAQAPVNSHQTDLLNPADPSLALGTASRTQTNKSNYDLFSEKLLELSQSTQDISSSVTVSGEDLIVLLGESDLKTISNQVLKLKEYRDAVEKQCKTEDASSQLLVNTLDHCLTNGLLYPAIKKSSFEVNRVKATFSQKTLNVCRSELAAYFREKEKKTDITEKNFFAADKETALTLENLFEKFGSKKVKEDSSVAASSELIKSLKGVSADKLCQVKLSKPANPSELDSGDSTSSQTPKKEDLGSSSSQNRSNYEYEEIEEESIEEEETYIPIKPKFIEVPKKPIQQPEPKPAPQPKVEGPRPTYQPVPYQPVPQPKPQKFEPVPPKKNNVPFIPAAPPAPRRAVVAGPPPVGPVAPFPIARSFGLSLGFSNFESNVQTPIIPPPMPLMPMMPMPVMGGGMGGFPGGGSLMGVSSGPRACLVCSSVPVTPMPTLGLANIMAQPCPPVMVGGVMTPRPVGACLPNMNQPALGFGGINPNVIQVPRILPGTIPGVPVVPGVPGVPGIPGVPSNPLTPISPPIYPGAPVNPINPGLTPAVPGGVTTVGTPPGITPGGTIPGGSPNVISPVPYDPFVNAGGIPPSRTTVPRGIKKRNSK